MNKKLTKTELFALNNGAVITTPFRFSGSGQDAFKLRPGDEIELDTEDEGQHTLRCRILDIESVRTDARLRTRMRVTLRKL